VHQEFKTFFLKERVVGFFLFPMCSHQVLNVFSSNLQKGFPKIVELWLVGTIIRNDLAKHMGENSKNAWKTCWEHFWGNKMPHLQKKVPNLQVQNLTCIFSSFFFLRWGVVSIGPSQKKSFKNFEPLP
jgi:hypothetical protein